MFFIIAHLINSLIAECNFTTQTDITFSEAYNCLKNNYPITPNSSEGRAYIEIIKKYLESYAYRDIMLNPPSPYNDSSIDIIDELDTLLNNLPSNGFEYMEQLIQIISRFEDAHTLFLPPCLNSFSFLLSYVFIFEPRDDETSNTVTSADVYLSAWNSKYKDYDSFKVLAVAMDNGTLPTDEEPWLTLAKYADENILQYRTPMARLNAGLRSSLFFFSAGNMPIPEVGAIHVKLLNTTDNTTEFETSLDYIARVSRNVSSLEELCPLRQLNTSSAAVHSNSGSSQFSHGRNISDEVVKLFAEFDAALPSIHSTPLSFFSSSSRHSSKRRATEQASIFNTLLRQTLTRVIKEEEHKLQKKFNQFSSIPESLFHDIQNQSQFGRTNADNVSLEFITNNDSLITGILKPANIGYICWTGFLPEDVPTASKNVVNSLLKFKKDNISKLIIDLTDNGGGYVALSANFFRLLFPEKFPISPRLTVASTDFARFNFPDSTGNTRAYMEYEDPNTTITSIFGEGGKNITISNSYRNVTRTREFTRSFSMSSDSVDYFDFYTIGSDYHRKRFYEPDDIIVLTEGTCGSACSQFIKHVHETHAAKIIGRGSLRARNESIGYDVGSFAGGNVVSSTTYEQAMSVRNIAYATLRELYPEVYPAAISSAASYGIPAVGEDEEPDFPDFFPRDCELTIDLSTSFSFNFSTPDEQLEFAMRSPDDVIPSFPHPLERPSSSHHLNAVNSAAQFFSKCYSWQVHATDECTKKVKNGSTNLTYISHAIYGHPCNTTDSSFTESLCVFAGCENGYYDRNGTCVEAKYSWSTITEAAVTIATGIIVIVVALVVVAVIIIIIVVVSCIIHHRRKKNSPPSTDNSALNADLMKSDEQNTQQ